MLRPQPIDLAPWPAGGLLLDDTPGGRAAQRAALEGADPLSAVDAPLWWTLAHADRTEDALAALLGEASPIAAYARLVLAPSETALDRARAAANGDDALRAMVEVAAFKCGLRDDFPDPAQVLDGELLASALAAAASAAAESGDLRTADAVLESAIDAALVASPGLAAHLGLSRLELARAAGMSAARQLEILDAAEAALPRASGAGPAAGFGTLRGELALERGVVLQESAGHDASRIKRASAYFQDALARLDAERHPRSHGFAQMRLGLCYMSLPMHDAGDALRMGVATQALKRAVETLRPEREPDLWCAAATNLANAYQLLPSGHLGENLERAVGLYDQALAIRAAADDPHGTARLLVNKAQAAASLERFDVAIEALARACPILQDLRLSGDLAAARHMLEDLRRQMTVSGDAL